MTWGVGVRYARLGISVAFTPYKADVTATEDITIVLGNSIFSAYLAAMDVYFGLSEYVTIGVERTLLAVAPKIVALTACEYITHHMAVIHLHCRLTSLIYAQKFSDRVRRTTWFHRTTSDSGNFTTTIYAVTNITVP